MCEEDIKSGRLHKGMSFNEKVWALCAQVPRGRVTTYGEIARRLGSKGFRAVGNALNKNPYSPDVPCHRVIGANGSLTGFAAGLEKKRKMLQAEGVAIENGRIRPSEIFRFGR